MPTTVAVPDIGALVEVRGQRWAVTEVSGTNTSTLVELQSVGDGRYGHTLSVIWEVEQDRRLLPAGSLPELNQEGFDSPDQLAAFLDAVRWSAVASADVKTLQAPFRSGVAVEDYQLEPLAMRETEHEINVLLPRDLTGTLPDAPQWSFRKPDAATTTDDGEMGDELGELPGDSVRGTR